MQTRTRYGLLMMLLTAILFMFASRVHCQENRKHLPEHPEHATVGDFYDSLRILKITVVSYNPASGIVDAKFEDSRRIDYMQFQVTKTTAVKDKLKGAVMIIYCVGLHGTGANNRIKYLLQVEKADD